MERNIKDPLNSLSLKNGTCDLKTWNAKNHIRPLWVMSTNERDNGKWPSMSKLTAEAVGFSPT